MAVNVLSVDANGDYPEVSVFNAAGDVDHNTTANYDANEHVDHTTVDIATAATTSGLSGGGDISATRNLVIDIPGTTDIGADLEGTDEFLVSDGGTLRRADISRISDYLGVGGIQYTAGAGVAKGDLVYVSANDTVAEHDTLTAAEYVVGVAQAAGAGTITVAKNDAICTGVLTGLTPTAGDKVFWTGAGGLSLTRHGTSGEHSWLAGVAKNADDLHVEVKYIAKNA